MCKVVIITNMNKVKKINTVTNIIAAHLQKYEKDGFGYAVQGKNGIYGERTVNKSFKSRITKLNLLVDLPIVKKTCNTFGEWSKADGAGIYHGRTSTNEVNLTNTHPLNKNGWSLIHNGVVRNHGEQYKKETTNDTEDLLYYLSTSGVQSIEKHITGYYAIGALDPEGNLHVIKDSMASLYCAYVQTIDSYIFATTETLITGICNEMEWKVGPIDAVMDNIYMIFDRKGEMVSLNEIKPRGYGYEESRYASKSLGYEIGDSGLIDGSKFVDLIDPKEEDYYSYLRECNNADSSYTIYDEKGKQLSVYDFKKLDDVSKTYCTVIRADGTVVDSEDYNSDKLYYGESYRGG